MNKRTGIILAVVIIVAIGATVVAATHRSSGSDMNMPMSSSAKPDTTNAVATSSVTIQNYMFSPMAIKVKVGTTVTWTNQDDVHHTITMDSGSADGPMSGEVGKGQTYTYTFKKAGTFTYHCMPHPYMHGTVVVSS